MMNDVQFPLLTLYSNLQKLGLPLTLSDYDDLLKVISHPSESGFNFQDRSSLIELCRFLWVKSPEQEQLFQRVIQTAIAQVFPPSTISKKRIKSKPEKSPQLKSSTPEREIKPTPEKSPQLKSPTPETESKETSTDIPPESEKLPPEQPDTQVIKAIPRIAKPDDRYSRFSTPGNYLPASFEQMQKTWLTLHTPISKGTPTEINIAATIDEINRKGILFDLVMKPQRQSSLKVILLLDQLGSMIPFQGLSRQLQETGITGGYLDKVETYYFHNCPIDELYKDPECWEEVSFNRLLGQQEAQKTAILIFSDAGAARGHRPNYNRIEETKIFLKRIRSYCQTLAWLNPLPKERWQGTSAIYIASLVEMFEGNCSGLEKAISRLKVGVRSHTNSL